MACRLSRTFFLPFCWKTMRQSERKGKDDELQGESASISNQRDYITDYCKLLIETESHNLLTNGKTDSIIMVGGISHLPKLRR